jgi:hypothetical protein
LTDSEISARVICLDPKLIGALYSPARGVAKTPHFP